VKWSRAVHHLSALADSCAEMAGRLSSIVSLRVTQLWAVGDVLGPPGELEHVTVALCVDLPMEQVACWTRPPGAEQWAYATRMTKNPILVWWRSAHAPVSNHRIDRPALIWDQGSGVIAETLAALRDGRGESVRSAAPSPAEMKVRLDEELAVSLAALRAASAAYEARRWSPGKLEPVADALWRASDGYLDVLAGNRETMNNR